MSIFALGGVFARKIFCLIDQDCTIDLKKDRFEPMDTWKALTFLLCLKSIFNGTWQGHITNEKISIPSG